MRVGMLMALVTTWLIGCAPAQADDVVGVLSKCSQLYGTLSPSWCEVTLNRQEDGWRVRALDLYGRQLTDADVGQVATLSTLRALGLRGDGKLSGKGLEKLQALKDLRTLSVSVWSLNGEGLSALSTLQGLEGLDLEYGGASDKDFVHLGSLVNLKRLNVERSLHLTEAGLQYLKGLIHLEELNLGNTSVADAGLSELKGLEKLRFLDLRQAKVIGSGLPALSSLGNLRVLKLLCHGSPGEGAKGLASLPQIEQLEFGALGSLMAKPWEGKIDFSSLASLKDLNIGEFQLGDKAEIVFPENLRRLTLRSGKLVSESWRLPSLRHLQYVGLVGGGYMEALAKLPELTELTVECTGDGALQDIGSLKSVRVLRLLPDCSRLTDNGLKELGKMDQLEVLEVPLADATDATLKALFGLRNLQQLKLWSLKQVTAGGLSGVRNLNKLKALNLQFSFKNTVGPVDAVLAEAKSLTDLEELTLTNTIITDEGLKSLASLKKLRRLNLTGTTGYTDAGLASLMNVLPDLQEVNRSYRPLGDQGQKKE